MTETTQETYVDHGFGFPVTVIDARIAHVGGESIPLIDYDVMQEAVIKIMPDKPGRMTGAEVRFIRLHFSMTLTEFGDRFGVTHAAVKKWENKGDHVSGMSWSTEKDLRLFVLDALGEKPKAFRLLYNRLKQKRPSSSEPLEIPFSQITSRNVQELAPA